MDFKEFSKKVGEGVVDTYKNVADKSGKMIEEARTKLSISDFQNEIEVSYEEIGKLVYESYTKGESVDKECTKICKKIDKANKEIEDMERKILYNRGFRECDKCGEIIPVDNEYCKNCGAKQKPVKLKKEKKEAIEEPKPVTKECVACGAICEGDAKFCAKCGKKL